MTHDEQYWREVVRRISLLNEQVARADVNSLWKYGSSHVGATQDDIRFLRERVGGALDKEYCQLLTVTDGWRGFYHDVDLFSCADNPTSEKVRRAWDLVESANEGSGRRLEISCEKYLPIAAAEFGIDVFLLELKDEGAAVRWIAGQEVQRFSSVACFIEEMGVHNETTLCELRADPWLGAR